ncbi:MAG: DUF1361 domain-containing protein, partial [Cyclobacteriaceae bacterium]
VAVIMRSKLSVTQVKILIGGFLFVTAFGIYIGRYLRWNSWDIVSKPLVLFGDVTDILLSPTAHPKAWGMTLLMGAMLNIVYWTCKPFKRTIDKL